MLRYNERLPAAYRARDKGLLQDAADDAEAERVGAVIAQLAARGQVMYAHPVDVRVEGATAKDGTIVLVNTVEKWVYEHRSLLDPGRPVEEKRQSYRMAYQVGLQDGVWRVQAAAVREDPR